METHFELSKHWRVEPEIYIMFSFYFKTYLHILVGKLS